jgi:TrwC relaxase
MGVLRVSKVRSGGGTYYLDVASGASGTGIEASGHWMGKGTPELGLSGLVGANDLAAVLSGLDPRSGETLGTRRNQVRVAGFDMTFSAPKSVSLLHALGDGEVSNAVAAGHAEAVGAALSYVERHALAVRRRDGTIPVALPTTVEGVAAAGFVHRVSRALDPHLHTGREREEPRGGTETTHPANRGGQGPTGGAPGGAVRAGGGEMAPNGTGKWCGVVGGPQRWSGVRG